jgi:hypothetical protein
MNTDDNITFLAQSAGKAARPLREDEVKKNIPYFEVFRNSANGKLDMRSFAYRGHDNEPRMTLYDAYFRQCIFPNVESEAIADMVGFYNIELHDGYNYLDNGKDYNGVLTFSKNKEDHLPVLIPDPYMVCNWGGSLQNIRDSVSFENKLNKVVFCGTTTGARDPTKNLRLQACRWALDNSELCEFKITKVAQMSELDCLRVYGDSWKDMYLPRFMSQNEQMSYKFHMIIDGNVSRFDIWPFKTNSLILKLASRDMLWYYPLIKNGYDYVELGDLNDLGDLCETYTNNPVAAKMITNNANKTASELFTPFAHTLYTVSLFHTMADNK